MLSYIPEVGVGLGVSVGVGLVGECGCGPWERVGCVRVECKGKSFFNLFKQNGSVWFLARTGRRENGPKM